jgi:hypothetical protein
VVSIRILSRIWESGPEDRGELLVLLALADFSNDAGESWPAVASIARKARMDERSARRILRKLEASGWLTSDIGGGRHGCSRYRINPDTVPHGHSVPPDKTSTKPGQNEPETRTPVSPEPSRTIKEPSVSKIRPRDEVREALEEVATPAAVTSFLAYRRKSKAGALTPTGARRLAASLREIFDAGGDTDDALAMAEERGWRSIKPDWYFKEAGNGQSHRTGQDTALRAIAAAARAF